MRRAIVIALTVVSTAVLGLGVPASADNTHTSIDLDCTTNPSTAGVPATHTWCFDFVDFGSTDNDKVDVFEILPALGTAINEDGTHDGADPSDGEKVGEVTFTTEWSYNLCDDNNTDGGTYSTYWEDTWTPYSVPTGWTKVAQRNSVLTVLFFFTENVPTHVLENNSTGQYRLVVDWPQARMCAGAQTSICSTLYGYAQNNSAQEWVIKNPPTAGTHTTSLTATEVGGTTHTDTDSVTIT